MFRCEKVLIFKIKHFKSFEIMKLKYLLKYILFLISYHH